MKSFSFNWRIPLGVASVLCISATAPQPLTLQVFDQHGMPVEGAVVELAPPPGNSRPLAFPWRNAMAQHNLAFQPGTLIVPVGAEVAFPNLDSVRHSIYSFSRVARFRIDLYGRDQTRSEKFALPGTVALGCNIHDKMRGYIRVVSTPFAAVTDINGMSRIDGLPAGPRRVTIWHPKLRAPGNEMVQSIVLVPGQRARVTIDER